MKGRAGALARARSLSPQRRSEIASQAALARWRSRKPVVSSAWWRSFCRRYRLARVYLFGSILRSDFTRNSDVDVMIDYRQTPSLGDMVRMREELERVFGRSVDLVTKWGVEHSQSLGRKEHILATAKEVYVNR